MNFCSAALDHVYPFGSLLFTTVGENPVHGPDRSRSPSTFPSSSMRLSSNTSKVLFVRLTTSMYLRLIFGKTLLLERRFQLLVEREKDECDSQKYYINRVGLQCHPPDGLMVETRPTLPEEHRCAPHLARDDPDLRWIFGRPDLFQPT